ncbi:MAG TPA: hypothetical protein PLO50_06145 [Nitrospira sp.]|nr:hypothetical protein [Nitrospira sp.]
MNQTQVEHHLYERHEDLCLLKCLAVSSLMEHRFPGQAQMKRRQRLRLCSSQRIQVSRYRSDSSSPIFVFGSARFIARSVGRLEQRQGAQAGTRFLLNIMFS